MRVDPQEQVSQSPPPPSLKEIAADRTHGAAWLSLRALQLLGHTAAHLDWSETDANQGWQELAQVARSLIAARPSMAVLRNRVNRLMFASRGLPAYEVVTLTERLIAEAIAAEQATAAAAAEHLAGRRVLTLSRSGTVTAALQMAQPPVAAVLVLESRPGGEGRAVAEELAESRLAVTLLPDTAAAVALAAPGTDLVLVGADAVLPEGSVVNKVGTHLLALAARERGIPCYAAASTDKLGEAAAGEETGDAHELYRGAAPLTVWAPLFEVTPGGLFAAILTERGPLPPGAIASLAAEHAELGSWSGA
jgi:ribose 1,5-bisphosphate isomerase